MAILSQPQCVNKQADWTVRASDIFKCIAFKENTCMIKQTLSNFFPVFSIQIGSWFVLVMTSQWTRYHIDHDQSHTISYYCTMALHYPVIFSLPFWPMAGSDNRTSDCLLHTVMAKQNGKVIHASCCVLMTAVEWGQLGAWRHHRMHILMG